MPWEYHDRPRIQGRFTYHRTRNRDDGIVQVHVYCDRETHHRIRARANALKMSMSDFMVWLVRQDRNQPGGGYDEVNVPRETIDSAYYDAQRERCRKESRGRSFEPW